MTWRLYLPRNQEAKDEPVFYLDNGSRTFTNTVCLVVQFYSSNMSRSVQFQLHSGYQVLPPRRRWDLCGGKVHQFRRRDAYLRVVGEEVWRCRAQEFLLGLWEDFEMVVGSGRSTPRSENRKELKRLNQCLRNSLIANWFKS